MGMIKSIQISEDAMTVILPSDIADKFCEVRDALSIDLGFAVADAQTVAWLVKREETHEERRKAYQHAADDIRPRETQLMDSERLLLHSFMASMDKAIMDIIHNPTGGANKIMAIKLVRERCAMGLKEAKDYVEALMQKNSIA